MLVRQPNGLFCIYDDVSDTPIKWNITKEHYVDMVIKKARKEIFDNLKYARNIKFVYDEFIPSDDMSEEKFDEFLKEIGSKETYENIHKFDPYGDGYDT